MSPDTPTNLASYNLATSTGDEINPQMSTSDIIACLSARGCIDIGDHLDKNSCGEIPIANGGYGDIYEGRLKSGAKVAIKTMRLAVNSDIESRTHLARAAHELYTWSKCRHRNVQPLLGLAEFKGQIGMVSLWEKNGNLAIYVQQRSETERYRLCTEVASGLSYLHQVGVIHGDLKASNVLVSEQGIPLLADFGNATLEKYTLNFIISSNRGAVSTRWTAPEILDGKVTFSFAADVFSLGMTMLETITGRLPWTGLKDVAVISSILVKKELPPRPQDCILASSLHGNAIWSLIQSCWTYEPDARPSAQNVQETMSHILDQEIGTQPGAADNIAVISEVIHDYENITSQLESCDDHATYSSGRREIYKGKLKNGTMVAIKTIRVLGDSDERNQKRHELATRELDIWSKCRHYCVQQLLGVVQLRGQIGMVSTWEINGNLSNYIAKNPKANRYRLSAQIAKGLSYLHQSGIVHGDLKGSNVLISADGIPLITDFGNANYQDNTAQYVNNLGGVGYTLRWAAPELVKQEVSCNFHTDVYALGMTILETITGDIPWSQTPREAVMFIILNGQKPPRPENRSLIGSWHRDYLWSLLEQCWNYDPAGRPSAAKVQKILESMEDLGLGDYQLKIESDTPPEEIIGQLTVRGCTDMTDQLDLTTCGNYPISSGGLGDIYRCCLVDGTKVAVKTIRLVIEKKNSNQKHLKYAARELYTWSKCSHPNVQPLLGLTMFRGQIGMITRWESNGNLPQYLKQFPDMDRCIISTQVADGLSYLHAAGVVHGNLQAKSILVSQNGAPQLTDFGNATLQEYTLQFTETKSRESDMLSLRWAAPELFHGAKPSVAADVYALGMTILEIITGSIPWAGSTDHAVIFSVVACKALPPRPNIKILNEDPYGDALWRLLKSCWEFQPEKRPSAAAVYLAMAGRKTDGRIEFALPEVGIQYDEAVANDTTQHIQLSPQAPSDSSFVMEPHRTSGGHGGHRLSRFRKWARRNYERVFHLIGARGFRQGGEVATNH